jgi:hypothetical protein
MIVGSVVCGFYMEFIARTNESGFAPPSEPFLNILFGTLASLAAGTAALLGYAAWSRHRNS